MVVLTRSAAKLKENQVVKPSKPEIAVTDQNLRAASKEPPAPKKNAKKLPDVRESADVAVNLPKTLVSEAADTKKKGEKQPASKVSSTIESPEAATKQNAISNMKPSEKKSTKKPRSKKCLSKDTLAEMPIQKAGKDHTKHPAK
ncbi:uncharacterized protein LOC6536513 isoform X4 [Drosophila yakuba]|uniref:Uncharacterized protein, isoform B n=1 Tax=Drosophila yakuba TaxID=7245 RepID=B4PKP3_DROYA|nr:uncharacterized protein LOC6536513 isoform X4 [Drosophila yakuba]EDW96802.2 uncharacterized protein Dyak_GE26030, isoform B [Drosophila yakuba]